MRILIVSDTHRFHDNYVLVLQKTGPVDMVIHCGDIEGEEYFICEKAGCPVEMVSGNNDFFSELPREAEFDLGKYHVLLTHGHNYCVSMGNEMLKKEAAARGADIVFYGHTHKPVVDIEKNVIAVNPGSLTYPRQDGKKPSYVVMDIDRNGEAHFNICFLSK